MSTERQKQASRANGSKSRGPSTPEGKRASSHNAEKHGLLSGTIVLEGESTDRFLDLVADLHEEFQPQTPFEESLIENMAAARWRQMRIWGMEKAGMDHETRRQAAMSDSSASGEDNATRAALAFRALSDESRSLELIHRYDTRYERQYYRAHRRFLEVRDRRTPPPNEPEPVSRRPGEGTFPTEGTQSDAGPRILEMPAPKENVSAKRTRQVAANKPSRPSAICVHPHSPAAKTGFPGFDLSICRVIDPDLTDGRRCSQPLAIPRL
ncbi:MAG TPA: hypothetical protein VGL82_22680 [Bryobacteraceae bacterium]|jgi:hypothetical protein